jgi:hypothetical protein
MSYRLARLSPDQMEAIDRLEQQLGVTLIAYEQGRPTEQDPGFHSVHNSILDALNDDYRSVDLAPYPEMVRPHGTDAFMPLDID